jgi:S1-C subfamily serine protease
MSSRKTALLAGLVALAALLGRTQFAPPSALSDAPAREDSLATGEHRTRLEGILRRAAVRVEDEHGTFLALATAVDDRGFLLAKASDLVTQSNLVARAFGGKSAIARRVGYDAANDLLLLKANLERLERPPTTAAEPGLGEFVFALDGHRRLSLRGGVISALPREVAKREGFMGIRMADRRGEEEGVRIFDVLPESGAREAGLRAGDLLVEVDGEPVETQRDVQRIVFKHDPGAQLRVRYRREGQEHEATVRLKHAATLGGDLFDRNQLMSGETSKRKTGFTRILQHEITLNRPAMGGPLLDGEGRLVGVNIARVNRVEVYAVPWAVVESALPGLGYPAPEP